MSKNHRVSSVPADPTQWSEKSKQSVAFHFRRKYEDISYKCWRCKAECVFTAQDQQYTFEVKKASIDQRRSLCSTCWLESHRIRARLKECEAQWSESKVNLQIDKVFLSNWLDLLIRLEEYVPYKPDTAKKNMLGKLLTEA
jgi:hypothetical protein